MKAALLLFLSIIYNKRQLTFLGVLLVSCCDYNNMLI